MAAKGLPKVTTKAHGVRELARDFACVYAAQALADYGDRFVVGLGQPVEAPHEAEQLRGSAPIVAQKPRQGVVAEPSEESPQQQGGAVPGGEARQHQHWMPIALGRVGRQGRPNHWQRCRFPKHPRQFGSQVPERRRPGLMVSHVKFFVQRRVPIPCNRSVIRECRQFPQRGQSFCCTAISSISGLICPGWLDPKHFQAGKSCR